VECFTEGPAGGRFGLRPMKGKGAGICVGLSGICKQGRSRVGCSYGCRRCFVLLLLVVVGVVRRGGKEVGAGGCRGRREERVDCESRRAGIHHAGRRV
jgi:hypothetical protein